MPFSYEKVRQELLEEQAKLKKQFQQFESGKYEGIGHGNHMADDGTEAFEQAERTLGAAEGVIGKDSPMKYQLTRTLEELSAAARSIRILAEYMERHPEALLRGKGGL